MEVRYIPDIMTASAMMQAGEADVWTDVAAVSNVLDLQKKGFKVNWGPGFFWALLPNSSDPNSPFAKKAVREAIEYAIDRPALAKMIGYGQFNPLTQMAPSGWPGYVQGYDPRPYNPAKAKELLKDVVGYMNTIAEQERLLGEMRTETEKLVRDQGRYRQNMQILNTNNPKESEKRAEYLERLTKIEERLEKLDNNIRETTEKQRFIRNELNQKVQAFTEE